MTVSVKWKVKASETGKFHSLQHMPEDPTPKVCRVQKTITTQQEVVVQNMYSVCTKTILSLETWWMLVVESLIRDRSFR